MVQKIFKISRSNTAQSGFEIITDSIDNPMDFPIVCLNDLEGKYLSAEEMIDKIDTIQIALAGVTDSLNIVDNYSYEHRSVIKSIILKKDGTINDTIDIIKSNSESEPESIIKNYEKYHTIVMDRDTEGNDNTIHAYIETPNDGRLRCTFDKSIRLNAKRNNIKYWIDDYKIDAGSAGGKFVRPIGLPIEIM